MQERQNPPDSPGQASPPVAGPMRRRRLRAVFAADIANFGSLVSIEETRTLDSLWFARKIATEELASYGGWLFGLPGDGIFALFESSVDAVGCALRIQARLAETPKVFALKLRIGVHLGEVLFQDELPFGETLCIAARLESLAEPGGILVSASVMEAVGSHIAATFSESGVPRLKHSTRRIETFRVSAPAPTGERCPSAALLDRTVAPEPASPRPAPRPAPDEAPVSARLPEATPLVLPSKTAARLDSLLPATSHDSLAPAPAVSPAPSSPEPAASLDEANLRQLTLLLVNHLGPMAKVLVRRKATENHDAEQLVLALAREFRTEDARRTFVAQARAVLSGAN